MVAGVLTPTAGSIARSGGLGVMGQFIGSIADDRTLTDLAVALAPPAVRAAGERLRRAERALDATERTQLRYADALAAWGELGGYAPPGTAADSDRREVFLSYRRADPHRPADRA